VVEFEVELVEVVDYRQVMEFDEKVLAEMKQTKIGSLI
jgi:adenine deaminase